MVTVALPPRRKERTTWARPYMFCFFILPFIPCPYVYIVNIHWFKYCIINKYSTSKILDFVVKHHTVPRDERPSTVLVLPIAVVENKKIYHFILGWLDRFSLPSVFVCFTSLRKSQVLFFFFVSEPFLAACNVCEWRNTIRTYIFSCYDFLFFSCLFSGKSSSSFGSRISGFLVDSFSFAFWGIMDTFSYQSRPLLNITKDFVVIQF